MVREPDDDDLSAKTHGSLNGPYWGQMLGGCKKKSD